MKKTVLLVNSGMACIKPLTDPYDKKYIREIIANEQGEFLFKENHRPYQRNIEDNIKTIIIDWTSFEMAGIDITSEFMGLVTDNLLINFFPGRDFPILVSFPCLT
jgi:hypothetical protein